MRVWLAQYETGERRLKVFYGTYGMKSRCEWLIPDTFANMDLTDRGEASY